MENGKMEKLEEVCERNINTTQILLSEKIESTGRNENLQHLKNMDAKVSPVIRLPPASTLFAATENLSNNTPNQQEDYLNPNDQVSCFSKLSSFPFPSMIYYPFQDGQSRMFYDNQSVDMQIPPLNSCVQSPPQIMESPCLNEYFSLPMRRFETSNNDSLTVPPKKRRKYVQPANSLPSIPCVGTNDRFPLSEYEETPKIKPEVPQILPQILPIVSGFSKKRKYLRKTIRIFDIPFDRDEILQMFNKAQHNRGMLPSGATKILRTWFCDNLYSPYPSREDKDILMRSSGLRETQVSNWFTNQRKRIWKPYVEKQRIKLGLSVEEIEKIIPRPRPRPRRKAKTSSDEKIGNTRKNGSIERRKKTNNESSQVFSIPVIVNSQNTTISMNMNMNIHQNFYLPKAKDSGIKKSSKCISRKREVIVPPKK